MFCISMYVNHISILRSFIMWKSLLKVRYLQDTGFKRVRKIEASKARDTSRHYKKASGVQIQPATPYYISDNWYPLGIYSTCAANTPLYYRLAPFQRGGPNLRGCLALRKMGAIAILGGASTAFVEVRYRKDNAWFVHRDRKLGLPIIGERPWGRAVLFMGTLKPSNKCYTRYQHDTSRKPRQTHICWGFIRITWVRSRRHILLLYHGRPMYSSVQMRTGLPL